MHKDVHRDECLWVNVINDDICFMEPKSWGWDMDVCCYKVLQYLWSSVVWLESRFSKYSVKNSFENKVKNLDTDI